MLGKLDLSNVTLVTVDTVCHELTLLAINTCTKHANFGDIKLFSNVDGLPNGEFIPGLASSFDKLTEFAIYELPYTIKTSHILFIHWDSWVIDPGMWTNEFLKYDYIGAPWWYHNDYNVGNSGFCLRSLELMKFMATHKDEFPLKMPEDSTLCREYQPRLPQFKWAPTPLAQAFAFERVRPAIDSRHFGFHGMFNWPFVLSYEELNERLELAKKNTYLKTTGMLDELNSIWFGIWGHLSKPVKIYKG